MKNLKIKNLKVSLINIVLLGVMSVGCFSLKANEVIINADLFELISNLAGNIEDINTGLSANGVIKNLTGQSPCAMNESLLILAENETPTESQQVDVPTPIINASPEVIRTFIENPFNDNRAPYIPAPSTTPTDATIPTSPSSKNNNDRLEKFKNGFRCLGDTPNTLDQDIALKDDHHGSQAQVQNWMACSNAENSNIEIKGETYDKSARADLRKIKNINSIILKEKCEQNSQCSPLRFDVNFKNQLKDESYLKISPNVEEEKNNRHQELMIFFPRRSTPTLKPIEGSENYELTLSNGEKVTYDKNLKVIDGVLREENGKINYTGYSTIIRAVSNNKYIELPSTHPSAKVQVVQKGKTCQLKASDIWMNRTDKNSEVVMKPVLATDDGMKSLIAKKCKINL